MYYCIHKCVYIYIYTEIQVLGLWIGRVCETNVRHSVALKWVSYEAMLSICSNHGALLLHIAVRSVFRISCLFLRPRPWQFEI